MKHKLLPLFVLLAVALTACAIQPRPDMAYGPPGFFYGLFHGFTCFFALIGGILWDVRVYAFPNSGWFYDLGYVIGVVCFFGATASSAQR